MTRQRRPLADGVPLELAAAVDAAGSVAALARVLQVDRQTVHRWIAGQRAVDGLALFAVRAFLRHPGDYGCGK